MSEKTPEQAKSCAVCEKTDADTGEQLKVCAQCHSTRYCSRECQKADWKTHKTVCTGRSTNASGSQSASAAASTTDSSAASGSPSATANPPNSSLSVKIEKPFTRLYEGKYLDDRPEKDVYKLLIDTYRFRMEDNYALEGEADIDSIYGQGDPTVGFTRFLRLAMQRKKLLPAWWGKKKTRACVEFGRRRGEWSELQCAIEKADVVEHYGDPLMPMQLRMLGEKVYGRGPAGQPGKTMMEVQMRKEAGGLTAAFRTIDISSMAGF